MKKVTVNRLKTKHTLIYQYINKIHTVLAVLFSLILLTSCEYFNRPMLDYLEEWTDTAQISKYTLDGNYPVTAGLPNVPSGEDRVITYYIINPQNYVLDSTVTFAHDETLVVDNNTPSDFAVVEQDLQDKNIIRLTLKNSVGATGILPLDGTGTAITPTITITEPNSGRKFNSYTVPFRINSAPVPVENPAILYDTTDNTYVICFNMPDINKSEDAPSIHRDIVSLSVSGDYATNYTVTAPVDSSENGLASGEGIINTYSDTWKPVAGGGAFIGDRDVRFAAIKTGINVASNTNPRCTLTLTDSSGLTATATATTEAQPLSAVVADKASGSVLKENDSVTFSHPAKGVKVHITCSPMKGVQHNGADLSDSVTGDGAVTLTFTTAGTYTITAYATMDGAGDSEPVTFTYVVEGESGGGITPPPDLTNYRIKAVQGGTELTKTGSYFVLEAGNPVVTFSLTDKNGTEIADASVQWKLSVDGTFVGQESTGSSYNFTFSDAEYPTDTYVLTVYAYVSGYLYSESFTVAKISSGRSVIDKPITIDRPIAIAPVSGEEVIITAGIDQPVFDITDGGELTLGGGDGTVTIDGGETDTLNGSSSLITVGTGGTLNITEGATIQNNKMSSGNGGGIAVSGGGTVNMDGGSITNCQGKSSGGGIYIQNGTFNMSGGTIDNCFATYQDDATWGGGGVSIGSKGIFNMSGNATIQNCRARIGGGVYVDRGTFNMSGGTIQNNTAEGTQTDGRWGGGGVFVTGTGSFTLTGGTISNNNVSGTSATGGAISINGTPTFKCEVDKIGTDIIIGNNTHNGAQDQINMIKGVKLAITENDPAKTLASRIQILEAADVKSGLTGAYDNATP